MVYDGANKSPPVDHSYTSMNSAITFPPARPVLKLARSHSSDPSDEKWAATLAEERCRLSEDQEALRTRETNLREYETRLRVLQAEIEAGAAIMTAPVRGTVTPFLRPSSKTPFESEGALQAAWKNCIEPENFLRPNRTI